MKSQRIKSILFDVATIVAIAATFVIVLMVLCYTLFEIADAIRPL